MVGADSPMRALICVLLVAAAPSTPAEDEKRERPRMMGTEIDGEWIDATALHPPHCTYGHLRVARPHFLLISIRRSFVPEMLLLSRDAAARLGVGPRTH